MQRPGPFTMELPRPYSSSSVADNPAMTAESSSGEIARPRRMFSLSYCSLAAVVGLFVTGSNAAGNGRSTSPSTKVATMGAPLVRKGDGAGGKLGFTSLCTGLSIAGMCLR